MWYLTDNPDAGRAFLPSGMDWAGEAFSSLDTRRQAASRVWGSGGERMFSAGAGDEAGCVIIDTAPESQFDALMRALKQDDVWPDSVNAIALAGTRFRGQRGRPWTALRGNLHYTSLYRFDVPVARVETGLTLLPVVAAAQAIERVTGGAARPRVKWVNDLFLDGAKVAGVLTATQIQGEAVQRAVFGIGINAACAPDLAPTRFVPRAGDLARFQIALPALLRALVEAMDAGVRVLRASGSEALFEAYRSRAAFLGRPVTIWPDDGGSGDSLGPLAQGRVTGLHPDLSLSIEGCAAPVRKGRMSFDVS